MSQQLLRFCLLIAALHAISNHAWAIKRESRVPIMGCNGYFSATGEARYLEVRFEAKQKDREELVVEVKNVPMPPGTTLLVYVDDEELGQIVLDKKRNGSFTLGSESSRHVPIIDPGVSVEVRTLQGRVVMR